MEVINKPEVTDAGNPSNGNSQPPKPPKKWKLGFLRPRKSRTAMLLERIAFVVVGAMFLTMTIFSIFTVIVTSNEPYLVPNVIDDTLHQDKVYIQIDGENSYRELVLTRDQIADPEDREVTQIPAGTGFKIIFTPKQADIPEHYKLVYRDPSNAGKNSDLEATLDRKVTRDVSGDFFVVTITNKDPKWPVGRFIIEMPDSGMFGGTLYAYLGVTDPNAPTATPGT